MKAHFSPLLAVGSIVFSLTNVLPAQDLAITSFAIANGGGKSTGNGFTLRGTIGQPEKAPSTGGTLKVKGGFWSGIVVVQTPGAPIIQLSPAGSNVILSWDANATGYRLQVTPLLRSNATWTDEGTTPILEDGRRRVTVSATGGMRYYRLRKP
ncbi:MAG: hypothetical protein ACPGVU_26735 [Limisphaerales bacterium]